MTRRLPNSTSPWNCSAEVRWPAEHSGQLLQPRPEPVRRTAPPVRTISAVSTSASWFSRWLSEGETVGRRRRDTWAKATGTCRLVPDEGPAVGCAAHVRRRPRCGRAASRGVAEDRGLRRPDEAADHRAPAGHDVAHHGGGAARAAARVADGGDAGGWRVGGGRAPTPSTWWSTATSTGS